MRKPARHLHPSDLRAMAQLATQATAGIVNMAEGVHHSVLSTLGLPTGSEPGQTGGVTGLVYQSVRGVTEMVGKGLDRLLAGLQPVFPEAPPGTPQREAFVAALNGVMGDHLAATNNPLATPMTLRYLGQALDWTSLPSAVPATGKVLLLIHGLCMNDLQWQSQYPGHGEVLASALGYVPIYVRYNTGLHVSQNGHQLSAQLEQLVNSWPVPIEELTVVAHSMGGLVTRSAFYYAQQEALGWSSKLKNLFFLGTPHHGAPLERAGNWVDGVLSSTPYTAPFSKLGQLRSAGITDLRYGHVVDEDWQGHDRFHRKPDDRQLVPLPEGVACYTVAATMASKRSALADRLVGDGLVPLHSALGHHDEARRSLHFAKSAQWIAYRTTHNGLLSSPEVTGHLQRWLESKSETSLPTSPKE